MAKFTYKVNIPEEFFDSTGVSKPQVMTDLQNVFSGIVTTGEWPAGWTVYLEDLTESKKRADK